ncbi:MAG TPA: PRC-barrel domain-containing protein [Streptosporangiaceae bacterium]|nr:PRC-barrel domain-containing protein [Streptosporangiaceae bacterium]
MAGTVKFTIGATVSCTDGVCGRVSRVVVDPLARVVTHLAVEPEHRQGLARLVPVDLAESGPDGITLRCTLAQFDQLDAAEETQFVPGTRGYEVYGPEQVLSWPYYHLGDTVMSPDQEGKVSQTVTVDTVPVGEVAVRRGVHVHATDGAIGKVEGLVIDPGSHHVTHVLLQEGHLWGRKQVAIPIGAVTNVDDGIRLSISKQQVEDLPAVSVTPPAG